MPMSHHIDTCSRLAGGQELDMLSLLFGSFWWNSVLEAVHWQGFSDSGFKLRIEERVDLMAWHSDLKYFHQRLRPVIIEDF